MVRFILFCSILWVPVAVACQADSIPSHILAIVNGREQIAIAFESNNRPDVQFWLDSLRRLEDDEFMALHWDERWLLYIWLENYTPLFSEVSYFNRTQEELAYQKFPPPRDSLFNLLDLRMYEDRAYLFDQIRKGWLSSEERAFATLMLDYLLRLSVTTAEKQDFDARLDAFLAEYPGSRFKLFMLRKLYNTPQPGNWAICLDLLFMQGNWSKGLERSLRPSFGGEFAASYWQNRWNFGMRLALGGQKLDRDVVENGYVWPKDDRSTFLAFELESGYDIYNQPKLRILPMLGAGFSTIHPPEDEENPNPDYYSDFKFNGWHLTAAIQADVKFNPGAQNVPTTYHGVRVRLGHRWLNLGGDNPAMQGNMFFFAVGYTIFGRQPYK